jgi:hypothetical protein
MNAPKLVRVVGKGNCWYAWILGTECFAYDQIMAVAVGMLIKQHYRELGIPESLTWEITLDLGKAAFDNPGQFGIAGFNYVDSLDDAPLAVSDREKRSRPF